MLKSEQKPHTPSITSSLTDGVPVPDTFSKYLLVHFILTSGVQRKHSEHSTSRTASTPSQVENAQTGHQSYHPARRRRDLKGQAAKGWGRACHPDEQRPGGKKANVWELEL